MLTALIVVGLLTPSGNLTAQDDSVATSEAPVVKKTQACKKYLPERLDHRQPDSDGPDQENIRNGYYAQFWNYK
jgi:hypothetical protein